MAARWLSGVLWCALGVLAVVDTASAQNAALVIPLCGTPGAQTACSATNPLPVSGSFTPGSTVGIVAGSAIIGKVGIDQTTDITTNGVEIAPTAAAAAGIAPGGVSTTVESGKVFKASAGNLYGFQVNIVTCAAPPCWVMVFNSTTVPADGAVTPVKWYQVGANQTLPVQYAVGSPPLKLGTGISLACSTTGPFTKTATVQCTFSGEFQ